jgi:cysteinyl-tRNA synthetase
MGLLQRSPNDYLQSEVGHDGQAPLDIDALIVARNDAKKAKNYAKADEIRKTLTEAGIVLEDTAQGTIWRRA